MRHVLDASAAVRVVLRDDGAAALVEALLASELVIAPSLFHSEVANTLWKYVRAKALKLSEAQARYRDAVDLVDSFEDDADLAVEALSEAAACTHSVDDLLYLVLARRRDCELLTADRALAGLWRTFRGAGH